MYVNYLCSRSFIILECPLGTPVGFQRRSASFFLHTYSYPACNSSCFLFWLTREKQPSEQGTQSILAFSSAEG